MKKLYLGVFASGRGSNFKAILDAIREGRLNAEVRLFLSNKSDAGALSIAEEYGVPTNVLSKQEFTSRNVFVEKMLSVLKEYKVEFIVLAGYMKKVPPEVISAYRNRILNIHPALLPSFGGKGMYGQYVHEAVLESGCKVTGVTVHIVDEVYDHGPIVAQQCVAVKDEDTSESLAARVIKVEHKIYPETLNFFVEGRVEVRGQKVFIKNQ